MAAMDVAIILRAVDRVTGPLRKIRESLNLTNTAVAAQPRRHGLLPSLAGAAAATGGIFALSGAIRQTVGASIEFQSAFADVRKVVDESPAGFQALRADILSMSKEIPVAASGLADIMAAAGQAGMAGGELTEFTRLAAQTSTAFDMTAGSVGEALAKVKTQLALSVGETREMADVINHLSNTSASSAPSILDFMKRVAAAGETFGFTARETAAIGSAMVATGAETDVAATSFRNVGKMLSRGASATKKQRDGFKALGLDARKVAKDFHEDATGTLVDVLELVKELPDYQQSSILEQIFGGEARALAPLAADIDILRDALRRVNDEAVEGSVLREFEVRAGTVANKLQLLRNNVAAVGIALGDLTLGPLGAFAGGLATRIGSLTEETDGLFQRIRAGFQGVSDGVGLEGRDIFAPLKQALASLDQFAFGTGSVERLGEISAQFRELGEAIKAVTAGDLSQLGRVATGIKEFVGQLGGLGAVGTVLGLSALSLSLKLIAGSLAAVARSPFFRLVAIAYAISTIISAAEGASSIGEFVANMSELSALDWVGVAAGAGAAGIAIAKLAKAAGGLRKLGGSGAGVLGGQVGDAAKQAGGRGAGLSGRAGVGLLGGAVAAISAPDMEGAAANSLALRKWAEESIFGDVSRWLRGLRGEATTGEGASLAPLDTSGIAAATDEIRNSLTTAGTEGGEGLRSGVEQGVDGAVTSVQSANDRVAGAFATLGPQLHSAGANAMLQLAAGIRSQQAAVSAAANEAATSIANKFPQSPAKEGPLRALPAMGREIINQLAGGMNAAAAGRAAVGVAGGIASTLAAGPAVAAAGRGGGGGVTVNLTMTNTISSSDASKVADELARAFNTRIQSALEDLGGVA